MELMDFKTYLNTAVEWLLSSGIQIVVILILAFAVLKVAKKVINRLFDRIQKDKDEEYNKRMNTLKSIFSVLATILILGVGLVLVLGEMGIQLGPILAAAGILGLAVGFGAQNLVQDVISGFFLLLEDQLRVGDVVTVGEKTGIVERITLRLIILRDLEGSVHYVRNGKIDIVTNMTKEESCYVLEIGVAYREDVDEVMEIIRQVDKEIRSESELKEDIWEPIEIMGLDRFEDSAVVIKSRIKTKPIMQWAIGREYKRRIKKRFDQLDIEIPYPHQTLYFGENKQGEAPAARVNIQEKSGWTPDR